MGEFSDFISTNSTEPGGALTEAEFFGAMEAAWRHVPRPPCIVTSTQVIEQGRAAARLYRLRAAAAMDEYRRLRRWRIFRRLRALRTFADCTLGAESFERLFGE